ncbi:L-rhamnose mutarotase [Telmatobacter bradus]|jgi:L-rhamnose mutarotase|uniref:L-rhamnose mutarotase n=1 Tax=Telmatobacter bradus TaxID=474953 RepID=UPI003B435E79
MRVSFLLKVRENMLEEYKRRHAAVWPEMLDALRRTGWKNYSLFARHDGLMIGYLECEDFKKCCDDMQLEPINAVWQKEMTPFFESLSGAAADESMIPLAEVFHLD